MHKEFTIITNLFMHEIQPLLNPATKGANPIQKRIMEFFRVLDDCVAVAINALNPDHIMVASDHSARPYLYSLNLNHFLQEAGLLKTKRVKKTLRHFLREAERKLLVRMAPRFKFDKLFNYPFFDAWKPLGDIDYAGSRAFGNRYIPGVYLNDERFNALVKETDKKHVTKEIIDLFNASAEAKRYHMKARPCRSRYGDAAARACLPDVWIDLPDTIFPEQKGLFVQKNPYWKSFNSLEFVPKDVMTGMKGRDALCGVEEKFVDDLSLDKEHDLTMAHQLILRHFEK